MKKIQLLTKTLLALVLLCVGTTAWADETYGIATPSQDVNTHATSGITVVGKYATGKIDNVTSSAIFQAKKDQPLYISSIKANIKGISFDYDSSASGSGTDDIMAIYTSSGAQFAIPTSGFTASYTPNGGIATEVNSLSGIAIPKDQSTHYTFSLGLSSTVSALYVITTSSTAAQIKNLVITYDEEKTVPNLYATITPSGTTNSYTVTGSGSMTASKIGNSKETMSGMDFYQLTGTNTYTPGENLEAGDIIVFTLANKSANTIGIKVPVVDEDYQITFSKSIASDPYQFVYVVTEDLASVSFARKSSADYLKDVKIYHNATVYHDVTVATSTGDNSRGTVSAASTSVAEGKKTTITAAPASGYKVTNWEVSGTGASISPNGASNSTTTTLTMGTADATVTCTFAEAETYSVTHSLTNVTKNSGATGEGAATESTEYTAVFEENAGYYLPNDITVTIGGITATKDTEYTWDKATGTCTIAGEYVSGDIVITITGVAYVAPDSGILFSLSNVGKGYENKSGNETQFTDITVTGGRAYGYGTSERAISYSSNKIKYAGAVNYIRLKLNYKLQVGDVISFTCDNETGLNFNSSGVSAAQNTDYTTGALNGTSYTVTKDDGLENANIIYCWRRTSSGTNVTSITIMRPATVTIGANGFTTFASESPLDLTAATQTAKGFTAYRASEINGTTVTFKDDVDQNVAANTGVLLKGTAGATVYIPVVASGTALANNAFLVNTTDATFTGDSGYTYYGMIKDSDPLTFGTFDPSSVAIPASKAYLKVANGGSAREIRAFFGDDITGISEAQAAEAAAEKDGKFVINGQLVIKKNGMMFNANGAQMK